MARLYTNENFPLPAVMELRIPGHDCETVFESGSANIQMPDAQVLEHTTLHRRAVVTFNRRHFVALHQQRPNHAGIIVCTFDPEFSRLARNIQKVIEPFADSLAGQLIRVTRGE